MSFAQRCALVGACVLVTVACDTASTSADALHVTPPHARLGPGESIQLRAVPPGDAFWSSSGPGGVDREGIYRAPYVVSTGTTVRVVVRRGPKESPTTAETVIELSTGAVPGAEDCLGPGQSWDENGRTPTYVQVDELPEAITRVQPEYSKSMQARGLSGGLIVNALVCRSGRVLDASAQWGRDRTPIPELEAAAVAAAKQWVFKPGAVGGQPVATFVAIPFVFPPR